MRNFIIFVTSMLFIAAGVYAQQHIGGQLNQAALENRTTEPTSGNVEGRIYFDTDDDVVKVYDGAAYQEVGAGSGDVVGPAGVTDESVAFFDGTTGKLLKETGIFRSTVTNGFGGAVGASGNLRIPDGGFTITNTNGTGNYNSIFLNEAPGTNTPLLLNQANPAASTFTLDVQQTGPQDAINIDHTGSSGNAMEIDSPNNANGVLIDNDTDGYALLIQHSVGANFDTGLNLSGDTQGDMMKVTSTSGTTAYFQNNNAVGIGKPAVRLQSQTGWVLNLKAPGGGNQIRVVTPSGLQNWDFTLPINDGDAGQVLTTDGSGTTSWDTPVTGPGAIPAAGRVAVYQDTSGDLLGAAPFGLPNTVGSNGEVLTTNADGTTSWAAAGGGGLSETETSIPLDNDFTGGTVELSKIGRQVTACTRLPTVSGSATSHTTSVGLIPAAYQPNTIYNGLTYGGAVASIMEINSSGTLTFSYSDTTSGSNFSSQPVNFCLSYLVP